MYVLWHYFQAQASEVLGKGNDSADAKVILKFLRVSIRFTLILYSQPKKKNK